jgi:hypothetical protein
MVPGAAFRAALITSGIASNVAPNVAIVRTTPESGSFFVLDRFIPEVAEYSLHAGTAMRP